MILRKHVLFVVVNIFASFILLITPFAAFAQTDPTPTPSASSVSWPQPCQDNNLTGQDCVNYLSSQVSNLKGQEQTLTAQISDMDSKINLTQAQIYATEEQISNLTLDINTTSQKITNLSTSLNTLTNVLLNRVVATYEVGTIQPMQILLTSSTVSDFLQRLNFLRIAQDHDKHLAFDTAQAKDSYQNQQDIFVAQKQQVEALKAKLDDYTTQLNQQKAQEQQLLTQTQGSEANYERLLSAAQAQLAGFRNFVVANGGASILTNQTVCDSWGCYYNQRDAQWGNIGINGTSTSIAEAGCLMTSMAMVLTHYGHQVTPLDVNVPGNFFSSTAYMLFTINVAGVTATRVSADIDSTLSSGNPVIVGISYDGGPIADHYVVLTSGSGGNYTMNDPFVPNGHEIPFTSHYSLGSIVEIERVSI